MGRIIVNVHGAGKQMSNFSDDLIGRLSQALGAAPKLVPCWYADLSNVGSPVLGLPTVDTPEALAFEAAFAREVERTRQSAGPGSLGLFDGAGFLATVPDLAMDLKRYFFEKSTREAIQARLVAALDAAKATGNDIVVVSHSLGTVVSYDVLRAAAGNYPIAAWITMGSPLRKVRNTGMRDAGLGAINEKTVPLWRNTYDTHDLVADAIGPAFANYPVQDVFYPIDNRPIEAHFYWTNPRVIAMIGALL